MPRRSKRRCGRRRRDRPDDPRWAARPGTLHADAVRGPCPHAERRDCSRANPTATCGSAGGRRSSRTENETIVVTSRAVMLYDRSLFYAHGQDPRRFDSVVVKSPHCQPHLFTDWAARSREHRCAGRNEREPAEPRPHDLPPADVPTRRRGDVHSPGPVVLEAALRGAAGRRDGVADPRRVATESGAEGEDPRDRGARPLWRHARRRLEQRAAGRRTRSTRSSRS